MNNSLEQVVTLIFLQPCRRINISATLIELVADCNQQIPVQLSRPAIFTRNFSASLYFIWEYVGTTTLRIYIDIYGFM